MGIYYSADFFSKIYSKIINITDGIKIAGSYEPAIDLNIRISRCPEPESDFQVL